ncbi:MAG: hypothetical protein ABW352_02525 [Polyangiales bacterium]
MLFPPRARLGAASLCLLIACGSDDAVQSSGLDASTSPAETCLDGGCLPPAVVDAAADARVFVPARAITGVRIDPPSATLRTVDGSRPSERLRVLARYDDGSEVEIPTAFFSVDSPVVGEFTGDTFVANGQIGGVVTARAEVRTALGVLQATAPITVSLERTLRVGTLPSEHEASFQAAAASDDATQTPALVYPLDGVVFPQNVYPVDVQWSRGSVGDLFRVTLRKPHAQVIAYLAYDPLRHWLVDTAAWQALARSEPGEPARLAVERLHEGKRYVDPARTLSFASTALTGSIYYWDVENARIQRIDDGSGSAVSFMPKPPISNDPETRCIGCHSVSNSGRYLAGRLGWGDSVGTVFDLTQDLSKDPAPSLWPPNERGLFWWFSSWSPDDKRLIVSANDALELRVYDPFAGVRVNTLGTALPRGTMPDWSPDGKRIAYVSNADNFGDKMTRGDLSMLDVTGADTFGPTRLLQRGSDLSGGVTSSYPTWSPDSRWLAFAHGTGARSETNESELYLIDPDDGSHRQLTRALSGTRLDYQPNFAPFQGGGYYWLSFLSRRTYGNDAIGNGTRELGKRQQIWVTAIRMDAASGTDPSSVAYWLPGQNTKTANISASWAPRACREDGAWCAVGSECCGGDCRPGASGALVCGPPPPEQCRPTYFVCNSNADCCTGNCVDRVCTPTPF